MDLLSNLPTVTIPTSVMIHTSPPPPPPRPLLPPRRPLPVAAARDESSLLNHVPHRTAATLEPSRPLGAFPQKHAVRAESGVFDSMQADPLGTFLGFIALFAVLGAVGQALQLHLRPAALSSAFQHLKQQDQQLPQAEESEAGEDEAEPEPPGHAEPGPAPSTKAGGRSKGRQRPSKEEETQRLRDAEESEVG